MNYSLLIYNYLVKSNILYLMINQFICQLKFKELIQKQILILLFRIFPKKTIQLIIYLEFMQYEMINGTQVNLEIISCFSGNLLVIIHLKERLRLSIMLQMRFLVQLVEIFHLCLHLYPLLWFHFLRFNLLLKIPLKKKKLNCKLDRLCKNVNLKKYKVLKKLQSYKSNFTKKKLCYSYHNSYHDIYCVVIVKNEDN